MNPQVQLDKDILAAFCRKWRGRPAREDSWSGLKLESFK